MSVCWGEQLLPKMDAEFTFGNSFPLCVGFSFHAD